MNLVTVYVVVLSVWMVAGMLLSLLSAIRPGSTVPAIAIVAAAALSTAAASAAGPVGGICALVAVPAVVLLAWGRSIRRRITRMPTDGEAADSL